MRLRRPLHPVHVLRQGAAVALLTTAVFLSLQTGPVPTGEAGVATVPVVVAARDLAAGTTLDAENLSVVQLPSDLRPTGSLDDAGSLSGRVLAAPLRSGEPVTDVRVVGAGVTELLPPGQVAAPVRLADLAVAALVRSGDRIDVLATAEGVEGAVLVAENALVLSASAAGTSAADDPAAGLLLVAVTPETAARLASAATAATLTLVLPRP